MRRLYAILVLLATAAIAGDYMVCYNRDTGEIYTFTDLGGLASNFPAASVIDANQTQIDFLRTNVGSIYTNGSVRLPTTNESALIRHWHAQNDSTEILTTNVTVFGNIILETKTWTNAAVQQTNASYISIGIWLFTGGNDVTGGTGATNLSQGQSLEILPGPYYRTVAAVDDDSHFTYSDDPIPGGELTVGGLQVTTNYYVTTNTTIANILFKDTGQTGQTTTITVMGTNWLFRNGILVNP